MISSLYIFDVHETSMHINFLSFHPVQHSRPYYIHLLSILSSILTLYSFSPTCHVSYITDQLKKKEKKMERSLGIECNTSLHIHKPTKTQTNEINDDDAQKYVPLRSYLH